VLGELPTAVDDASQAPCHDVQDASNACEQKNWSKRELNGMGHVAEVQC
jgi:hypothetical protein